MARRDLLVGNSRKTAVDSLFLSIGHCSDDHSGSRAEELTTRGIGIDFACRRTLRILFTDWAENGIGDRTAMTFGETFHAVDTAGIIDRVVLAVDAGRLAVACAETAAVTLRGVNDRLQPSETGEKPRTVPTGQMVLQYVRPFLHARTARTARVATATARVTPPRIQRSTV